jgi:predicted nucleic acid-binding Zn ribbon protein
MKSIKKEKKYIMKKKCLVCNKEFEVLHGRGSEQKYCSHDCRTIAAQERNKQRIIEGYENQKTNYNRTSVIQDSGRSIKENSGRTEDRIGSINNEIPISEREMDREIRTNRTYGKGSGSDNYLFELIERNYATQNEGNINKLKLELALKEIEQLKSQVNILESELEELEEEEEPKNAFLSGIVEQFKADPQATIQLTKELIPMMPDIFASFFKPKEATVS